MGEKTIQIIMTALFVLCIGLNGFTMKRVAQLNAQPTAGSQYDPIPMSALQSVVRLRVPAVDLLGQPGEARGSGVIVGMYLIVTARHVTDGQINLLVDVFQPTGGYRTIRGRVVYVDAYTDQALVRTDEMLSPHQVALGIQDAHQLVPGSALVAVGAAVGATPWTATQGYFAARGTPDIPGHEFWWQMSTPVWQGNSGGAVFDPHTWNLVGIVVATSGPTSSYFLPCDEIVSFLKRCGE